MNRKCNFYFLIIWCFILPTFKANSQTNIEEGLYIKHFSTREGYPSKQINWNSNKSIKISSKASLISITVGEKNTNDKLNLICLLIEPIKNYDTLKLGPNPTINFSNLSGGEYTLTFINLATKHQAEIKFSIEVAFWEKWWFSPFVFLVISIILGLIFYFFYLVRLRSQLQLQTVRHELEIKALRAQMNPHFIFNSMNTIDAYILRKKFIEASDCLQKFSKLIRKTLENSENQTISIQQELETLTLYIELEQERFSHSFEYKLEIDSELTVKNYQIPPLLIQPFAENAILHGIRHLTDRKGEILVKMKILDKHFLQCEIIDNGIGRNASKIINLKKQNEHKSMGINITLERILAHQKLYGDKMETKIEDFETGTSVIIKLPLILS